MRKGPMNVAMEAGKPLQGLLIGDLARHLARLAAVEQDKRTGNPSLSKGLTLLANCLRRHKSRPVTDLSGLRLEQCVPQVRKARKPRLELPDQLDTLNWDQVVAILEDEGYQKKQLIELGEKRLGIPPSRLLRLKRADAITSIRAALDNERTLAAIGRHARLAGERRAD